MTRRLTALSGGALAAVALAATPAAAATLSTDSRCYSSNSRGTYEGEGFTPNATYTVRLSTGASDRGRVSADGSVQGTFRAPNAGSRQRDVRVSVSDGTNRASTVFTSTGFSASFSPQTGNPATLRVRFFLYGFGARRAIYLHYISPQGDHRATVRLGPTTGRCGRLVSSRLRIFPFAAGPGTWRLRFDARARYSRRPAAPYYTLRLPIIQRKR